MNDVVISKDIVDSYYKAIRSCIECNPYELKEFCENYPCEYKLLSAVHRRRSKINTAVKALKRLNRDIYWGTLTFNSKKNNNLVRTKRREAFISLNKIFDYVLLVEEFGSKNGRYHIHFIGSLKFGCTRADLFRKDIWSSRRDIELVDTKKNVASYLVKYFSKDLPRIRCNKLMCELIKQYKEGERLENLHFSYGIDEHIQGVNCVTIFDLEL